MMNATSETTSSRDTILLVDDGADNLIVMKKVLNNSLPDVEIATIQRPKEVMDFLGASGVSVALIDVQMPGINGIELCNLIKAEEETQYIHVMLVTSHDASSSLRADGLEVGADDFITRPMDNTEFVARVKVALRISRVESELRRKAEKAQHDYKLFFDRMVSGFAVHEMIFDTEGNPEDYRFLSVNPQFETLTKLCAHDIIGKTASEVLPDLEPSWIEKYGRVVSTGEPMSFEDYSPLLDKHVEVAAFRTSENQFATTFTDITERIQLEERLNQAEKMEAIGQLAGGIAHDFNNILGGIIGYADMSLEQVPEGSGLENNIKQILTAGERATHLVKQILSFSRQSAGTKTALYINPIIEEAIQLLRASLPSSIEISTNLPKGKKSVFVAATKIHEIIMNICTNAAHAMDEKGILKLSCVEKEIESEIDGLSGTIEAGSYSVITIVDNGCGMDEEVLSHIFEPFFTTKEIGDGTGMGLAVVFGIVQGHGGNINIESEPGKGTTFQIFLPNVDVNPLKDGNEQTVLKGGKERILFVDDEQVLSDIAGEMLGELGYSVTLYTDATKALQAFRQTPDSFDLVITDQTMPKMTGFELSKELLGIRQNIPIILCTGYSRVVDTQKIDESGIKDFALKPIRKKDLAHKIRTVLDGN